MSDKVNAKLYRIKDSILEKRPDPIILIDQIVEAYYKRSNNSFSEIQLKDSLSLENYRAKLFVFNTSKRAPSWMDFLHEIVIDPEDLVQLETQNSSFILFVYSDNEIYAVTKGYHGHHLLSDYVDRFFGLEVMSRLIDKSATEIKQLEERGLFGIEIGAQRFFKDNYNLSYEDDFGKIYKDMLASIDEKNFEKLGIIKKREDIVKLSIHGSTSFEVSTNFNYEELIIRVDKISHLLRTKGVEFNQFYRLSLHENALLKSDLNEALFEMAFESLSKKENIDFYHPEVINYLRSTEIQFNVLGDFIEIPYGSSLTFIDLMNRLIEKKVINDSCKNEFIESLKNCFGGFKINEYDDYSNEVSLDNWIGGEVELKNEKYFKIDNAWYRYRPDFDKYLNNYFSEFNFNDLSSFSNLEPWYSTIKDEGDYNKKQAKEEGFILGDTAFFNYIEICDLIKISDDKIFLYHVKKGLGRDLRVLSNQIVNSSRILTNALYESNSKTLNEYYDSISKANYDGKEVIYLRNGLKTILTKNEFVTLFKLKRIIYVFAYSSSSKKKIKEEIIASNSRIAKLSLIYCNRDMRKVNFDFKIERIPEKHMK